MGILTTVAAKIAGLTVEPIVKQVGYLLCYRNNLKELKDLADQLQETKERIDHKVEAERRNGREIEGDVLKWQESVIKTLEEAKKLWEDPHDVNVWCFEWCFPNLMSQYQHSRKAKEMADTIVEMKGKGKFAEGVSYVPYLDITNNLPILRESDGLESRKSIKEDVILSLKDPKVNKIGVYGIGGVGKTTLVQEVAKQVKHDKLFDVVLIVTISQTNLERIQDEIAEQLDLRLEERTSTSGRANRLCERIKKEETILIILDDLLEKIDLDKLGIPSLDIWGKMNQEKVGVPLKDDYKGCKLLMTSRSRDILQKNDAQKNFSLQVLNDEESWSLFEAMVGDVVNDDNFRKIATQVAQRCVGLPVLIVTTAKSLKYNKDIYYWKDTLKNLKRVDNSRDMNKTLLSALEFNFNRLEDEVKKVFLLCGVNGTSILVSDLLKYAFGLGIFKCINTIEDARNRLYRIIIDLKASCLLVDDDARAEIIKMHDIVYEVAVSMTSKYAFTKINANFQDWPRKDILEGCTHIILDLCCIQKLPERLDCPQLTFLHIDSSDNRTLKIPNFFFEGMGNLEVLYLIGLTIASLPISLSSLTKLKTLCLDNCSLKDMTGIGALMNLEILSLIHSSVEEFPGEIKQLTKLRMLDLSRSGIGASLPNILGKLTKIEELYMGDATINWEVESSTTQKRNASLAKLGDLTGLTTLEIQIHEAWLLPKDIAFDKLDRYKVVIGDKWEWSDNKETSRLLKVKLDTSIHQEQGIKTLIKRVEDLYLDKISGISNVLFELNAEGFPLLRHLHIQNNGEIQHIVNPMKKNQTHVLFPELETMILYNLNNLVKICHSSVRVNSFGKLKVVKVRSCDQLVHLFSVSMVKAFSQLVEIEVSECSSMKKIVSIESTNSGKTFNEKIELLPLRSLTLQHLPTIDYFCSHELTSSVGTMESLLAVNIWTPFFSAKVKISNLETLKLSSVNLKKIWDDSSAPYLVHNLANLTVENCSGLKYLFSPSMVGRLSNLKQLEISKCDMMEEIIATEEINAVALGELLFPKLEAIIIKDMQNLKTIWHVILASNSLACLTTLEVKNCEKIEKIFPEYMNGAFAALETLKVKDCESVQEIFQLGDNADDKPQLKYITLLRLPQLKQVWSRDPQSSHCFKSLQVVRVEDCEHLEHLFPFSIAGHLPQLEAITIKNAEKMKEIVSKREGPLDNIVDFEFDQLTSIVLWNLHDLQGFYAGNHSLSCSSLKILDVWNCGKLKLFRTQCMSSSQGRHYDDNLSVSMQQSLFTLEEVIDNLENLDLSGEDARMIFQSQIPRDQFRKLKFLQLLEFGAQSTSPYWFLQNMSNLESLVIQDMFFKVIFPDERPQDENAEIDIKTRLKKLTLYRLYKLQHICKEGCQLDPVLEVLEYLDVDECSNLMYLVPSSVTFNNLTCLEVQNCKRLIYLITSSTARSLVNLKTLKIIWCNLVEQIVEEAGGESICEIAFQSLEVLELESLPKLKMFCSSGICYLKLPVLEKLVIRQCARMESFSARDTSTPLLREILTDEQDKKWFCEGDLNKTVNKIFQDKFQVACRGYERLELSQYPELRELWLSYVQSGVFGNLKDLVVQKCEFLSKVLLPLNLLKALSNLEKLQVSKCDSLEAVFDISNVNGNDVPVRETIQLKRISLSCLPELKHIWKQNYQETVCFRETTEEGCIQRGQPAYSSGQVVLPDLETIIIKQMQKLETIWHPILCPNSLSKFQTLKISKCGKIENIYPLYMQGAFTNLETLIVSGCSSLKEIFQPDIKDEEHPTKLKNLTLLRLPQLQQIWSRDSQSSLRLENLQIVRVEYCGCLEYVFPYSIAMGLFQIEQITIKCAWKMKKIFSGTEEPLDCPPKFEFNRMISLVLWRLPELQELWSSHVQMGIFGSLTNLVVHKCDILSDVLLPLNLLQALSNLEELKISDCDSLRAVFDLTNMNERGMSAKVIIHLKTIELSRLPELKHIWKINCQEEEEDNECDIQHDGQPAIFRQVYLPNLETFTIEDMENLETIWHPVLTPNSMGNFATLKVKSCQTIEHIFPICMDGAFATLETLMVEHCNSVHEIFQLGVKDMCNGDDTTQLKNIKLLSLPKLKHIWSRDPQSGLRFKNLQVVSVEDCEDLEYLFPFSIAMNLPLLEQITIKRAERIKEIVSKREEPLDNPVKFVFKSLTSLVLWNLHDLEGFCAGNHILTCHSLKELDVFRCMKLKRFTTQRSSGQGRPLLTLEEVIGNLEELALSSDDVRIILQGQYSGEQFSKLRILFLTDFEDDQTTFPYWFLQNMTGLEQLIVDWSSFKEIFPQEVCLKIENKTRIKTLKLIQLHELQHICKEGCQLDPVLEVLECLKVNECSNLKHLVPSSVTFNHLTYLKVQNCKGLIYLITSSTARSLVNLTTLKIIRCDLVEQIVEEAGGGSTCEIAFQSLEVLELESLPKLKMFCSSSICCLKLPVLEELVIRQCARMESFSARDTSIPLLREILTDEQDKKWFCDGDLNKTVNKMFQDKVAFRSAKHLELSEYPELKYLWSGHVQMGIFGSLTNLVVHKCDFLSDVLLPLNLLQALSNLEELKVSDCDFLRAVFDLTNMNERGMSVKVIIHLKTIELSRLPELKHIWKINCQEEEEDNEYDIHHDEQPAIFRQVYLPNLETFTIEDMENLETIWHPLLTPNSMGNFETLKVKSCQIIEHIFPICMDGAFATLETLMVEHCNSVHEIFQLGVKDMCNGDDTTQLKNIKLLSLPKLKHIWSRDPQSGLRFKNLQVVSVEDCEDLEYLFPFSIAMNVPLLEQITIKRAERIKEIVSKREEPLDNPVKFVFKSLTSLVLWNLHDLEGFCAGNHILTCHSLKELDVFRCMKLKLFTTQRSSGQGRPLLTLEEVIGNLEELALSSDDVRIILQGQYSGEQFSKLRILFLTDVEYDQTTFPYWFLQNMTGLEQLIVEWSSFKEIFPQEVHLKIENNTRIKTLKLIQLHELQHICKEECQLDPILEVLQYLHVDQCSSLKNLVPSSVKFSNLTCLEMQNCNGLIYLITSSTARSLVNLTTLKIIRCDLVEQIVEEAEGGSTCEIAFQSLEVLELESLPKLKMFCSSSICCLKLPLLKKLVIRQCARMESFSARDTSIPLLREILTDEQDKKWFCEGDLNKTVNKMFQDKVAFRSAKHLELSEYPELKDLWSSHVQMGIFGSLTNLVVHKCDFFSDVLLPLNLLQALSNLEELKVSECDSLRAVFDLTKMNERGMPVKVIIHLKTIELSRLPELKHIWKINCQEEEEDNEYDIQRDEQPAIFRQVYLPKLETLTIEDVENLETIWHPLLTPNSMGNFETLKVKCCQTIKHIFPICMDGAFATLETLMVEHCNSVHEIFQLGVKDMCNGDDTTQLKNIKLLSLPKLKHIWSRDPQSGLRFKNLQVVSVEDCEDLEYLFPFSIAMNLPLLEQITIKEAERIKEIVSKREEPLDNPVKFVFKSLTSLVLWNLHDLEGFCAGNHILTCHSLKELDVFRCMKLKLFTTQRASGQRRPLLTLEEVIGNLEKLTLSSDDVRIILEGQYSGEQFCKLRILFLTDFEDDQTTFPYLFLQNMTGLEQLNVEWGSFKEIFPQEVRLKIENKTRIKILNLIELHELQHICKEGCQLDQILEVLECLKVKECSNLKHLVPASVTFNHLTYLEVQNCKGLIYLITSSTAKSLVKLTTLKIRDCGLVEKIVADGGGESSNEIEFNSLEVLELGSLQKLCSFASSNCFLTLPLLEKLVIRECPKMKTFSTSGTSAPSLREILTDEPDEQCFCDGDLNSTVNKIFHDKLQVAFRGYQRLELSQYPELRDLWYSYVQSGVFGNLKDLIVQKCDFLSKVLLPLNLLKALTNLEKLQVSECDSLEAVFDISNVNGNEVPVGETIQLKRITLSSLHELKHIWKQNYQETVFFRQTTEEGCIQRGQPAYSSGQVVLPNLETIIIKEMQNLETVWHPILCPNSMGNFQTLEISKCGKIENIYPLYMQGAFTNLETLTVTECSSLKEIFQLDIKDWEHPTKLKNITLLRLPQLQQIWSRDSQSSLQLENLKIMRVEYCGDLQYVFPFSIAMGLLQIEQITIKYAGKMKEIFSGKEGPLDCPPKFEFNHMTSLVLWSLPEFQGFLSQSHSLACPSLKILDVRSCSKWSLFKKQGTANEGKVIDSSLQSSTQRPSFPKEVICNLETLALNYEDASMIVQGQFFGEQFHTLKNLILSRFEDDQACFPYGFLQNAISLNAMVIENSSFKEIFEHERKNGIQTRIKRLTLNQLHGLLDICKDGFQIDPVLELLEYLCVKYCSKLKHLVPSSVSFSLLTYLEVHNCNELLHLITSPTARSLIKLTTMKIRACNSLEQVMPEENESVNEIVFSSLQVLELECLPRFKIFSSVKCVLKLPLLTKLIVVQCPRMKSFSMSNTSAPKLQKVLTDKQDGKWCWEDDLNKTIDKIFQDKVAFSSFNHLELSEYPELREMWYSYVQSGVFGNLKDLVVQKCDFLSKVLLPLNLLKALTNLEKLQVSKCDSLEAVFDISNVNGNEVPASETIQLKSITLSCLPELKHIWKQNYQETVCFRETTEEGCIQRGQPAYSSRQVVLPNMETIIIKEMQNLETVWHPILCPNSMGNFQTLEISKCGKIENIYPLYMQGAFTNLETLTVTECSSLKEIFQLDIKHEEHPKKLKNITLLQLPKLQQIWSGDSQSSLRLENLQIVRVEYCGDLEYIFPFSTAMGLLQIEQITIKYAGKMKEIFSGKEGPLDCPPKFEFNRMTSLVLWSLYEFQGFLSQSHSLACPCLKILDVRSCSKWSLFKKQSTANEGKVIDSNLQSSTQRPPFPREVICNLEKLALNYEDASMIVQGQFSREQFFTLKSLILSWFEDDQACFPYCFLQNAICLNAMVVENSSFKEIFQNERQNEIQTRIKKLTLNHLHELLDICKDGFQIDPVLELLEYLCVKYCSKLKHLVPSSVSFSLLTYLEVHNCNGLLHLITSPTARSLIKLTTMKIRACNSLKQVMPEENEEILNEIAFSSLQVLELECLQRFKIFSSVKCVLKLPLLTKLIIVQCPRMKSFSMGNTIAPKLQKILTGKQDGKCCWEGDLNRTVDKIFQDKVAFSSFNHLELSEYPELKELWYGQIGPKIFCNLKHLVVRKCKFLPDMLFSSNLLQLLHALEELEVAECDLLEVVFDVKAMDDKEMESKDVSRLKKLTLSGLPNLKRIWNREAEEIISFGNLQIVKVDKCQHLKYLFSVLLCQDFRQLQELHIESCGVEEIVAIEEGLLEELKFEFPRLISLKLLNLTQLTNFCSKRYTLECPSLKILNVYGCEELPIFAFEDLNSQPLREGDTELQIEQALFDIEKVSQNLEQLSLNEKDAMRILSGSYEKNLFQSIKVLRLQHFQEIPIKFLNGLIQKFPATTTVQVRHSSLETLFPSKEIDHCSVEIPSQIKKLWLFQLEQLEHIWNDDDSISHPLVGNLEYLSIIGCSRIQIWASPSASFKNLTSLTVQDCNGLLYFMTSCTAKSLINLTSLTVSNCGMLEEAVMMDEGESEEEITFASLKYLELTCLSGLKSFCSGKHTFIFQSLVTLKVIECSRMQNFSSGVIIAPFLKLVEVENGKKHWKEGLNTTIKQLFINKAIEGVEGDYIESSSIIQSSQTYQKSVGTSRALIFEKQVAESKAQEIVDLREQKIQKVLNIPQTVDDTRKICEIIETPLNQASQSTLSLTKVDTGIKTEEMKETIQTPFAEVVTLTHTSVQEIDLGTHDETFERPLVQTGHQGTLSLSIVQDTEKLHSDIRNQEMYKTSGKGLVPVAQNVLSSSMVDNIAINPTRSQALEAMTSSIQDGDIGNKELHETSQRLLVQNVEDMLIPASSVQNIATEAHVSIDKPFFQATQNAWDITIVEKKGADTRKICEIVETPLNQVSQFILSLTKVDAEARTGEEMDGMHEPTKGDFAIETEEMKETIQIPFAEAVALTHTSVQETDKLHSDIRNQEMCKTSDKALVPVDQNVLSSSMADNIAINPSRSQALEAMTSSIKNGALQNQEIYGNSVERPFVKSAKIALTTNTIYDADKSQDLRLHPSENLLVQTRSIISDNEENVGNKELHETSQRLLVQNVEDMLIPASSVQDIATETHVGIDKPFFEATQNAWDITIVEKKEESHDSDIHLSKNLFNQTITFTAADDKEKIIFPAVGTQETYESKRRFSVPYAQNVLSSTIVYNTGNSYDPEIILENLSSQATNSVIAENRATVDQSPSTTAVANFCSSFKELDISVQLLPYLESGVKQHPQVLNWLNTKRRRVSASSYFSLFAEVTRILRTTQKEHLTEDDRNCIREYCGVLQGVAFDESWISYVHGFIEECGDGEDLINREVEEAEGEASNPKAQIESTKELASVKESLALLCDKAQGSMIPWSSEVRRFSWRSTCKSIFIFITIYLLMCVLIYSLSNLPL